MKEYIGDGCYAEWDGYAIDLTTEDGVRVTNRVYLEPEVYAALVRFRDRVATPLPGETGRGNGT